MSEQAAPMSTEYQFETTLESIDTMRRDISTLKDDATFHEFTWLSIMLDVAMYQLYKCTKEIERLAKSDPHNPNSYDPRIGQG